MYSALNSESDSSIIIVSLLLLFLSVSITTGSAAHPFISGSVGCVHQQTILWRVLVSAFPTLKLSLIPFGSQGMGTTGH